jgi:hypothetical protein
VGECPQTIPVECKHDAIAEYPMSDPTNQELKELILNLEKQIEKQILSLDKKIDTNFLELKAEIQRVEDSLGSEIKLAEEKLGGEIKRIDARLDGIDKRLGNEEFVSRSAFVAIVVAMLGGLTKYLFFTPNL